MQEQVNRAKLGQEQASDITSQALMMRILCRLQSVNGNELRLCLDPQRQALYARKVNELEAVDPLLRSPWETCRFVIWTCTFNASC